MSLVALAPGCRGGCGAPPASVGRVCIRAASIPRIDAHAHIRQDATERALAVMDAWGISRSVNVSGGYRDKVLLSQAVERETGGRILFFCNIDFTDWGTDRFASTAVDSLARCKGLGGRGLKIFKGLGLGLEYEDGRLVPVDDPILDPIFAKAGELGIPILIHSGDPKAFFEPPTKDNERYEELAEHPDWSFHGGKYPSWEEVYRQFENRVARHPDAIFIGAHFGNDPEDPERVFEMMHDHPNLYIDTAARVPEIGRFDAVRMKQLFDAYQDRILFGTDMGLSNKSFILGSGPPYQPTDAQIERFFTATWRYFETRDRQFDNPTPIQGRWKIDGIGLGCDVLEKVYHLNIERLLGLTGEGS
jgi:predicted TIM-barrel fold metal-dependent hydrolase